MNRFRAKAWWATVVVAAALSCRFRYEQLDVTSGGVGGVGTTAGDASSGAISPGGASDTLGGAMGSVDGGADGEGGVGAVAVGGMDGTMGGTSAGTSSGNGGSSTAGSSAGGGSAGADPGPGVCVPDATCSCEVFQGHDYRFCAIPAVRDAGLAACQAANMVLVRVDSAEENAWVLQQFIDHGMFIGAGGPIVFLDGNDIQVEGMWRFEDGTLFWDGAAVGGVYTNWATPPTRVNSDCLGMTSNGLWGEHPCTAGNATAACESP